MCECCNCNRGVASATMQVGTTTAVLQTNVNVCAARERQIFRVYVSSNTGTTQTVSLGFCNGGTFPVFLQSTGAQSTAANFVEGVTYLVSYDNYSKKFFLVGI
jgi:hypothetical protein